MLAKLFSQKYNPEYKCIVTYRNRQGEIEQGVALDDVQKSATGEEFVFIDNFFNRVPVGEIAIVEVTDRPWVTIPSQLKVTNF